MNRDALLATCIGFGIGLVFMSIFLAGPTLLGKFPKISFPKFSFFETKSKPVPTPSPTPKPEKKFSVTSPHEDALESTSELLVSGTAIPSAIVVVEGPLGEEITMVKDDGVFAGKVTLNEGKNEVKVTHYSDGKTDVITRTIFFTTESY